MPCAHHHRVPVASEHPPYSLACALAGLPDAARQQLHRTRVIVPARVVALLRREPQLLAPAVEAFHYRDVDDMRVSYPLSLCYRRAVLPLSWLFRLFLTAGRAVCHGRLFAWLRSLSALGFDCLAGRIKVAWSSGSHPVNHSSPWLMPPPPATPRQAGWRGMCSAWPLIVHSMACSHSLYRLRLRAPACRPQPAWRSSHPRTWCPAAPPSHAACTPSWRCKSSTP